MPTTSAPPPFAALSDNRELRITAHLPIAYSPPPEAVATDPEICDLSIVMAPSLAIPPPYSARLDMTRTTVMLRFPVAGVAL